MVLELLEWVDGFVQGEKFRGEHFALPQIIDQSLFFDVDLYILLGFVPGQLAILPHFSINEVNLLIALKRRFKIEFVKQTVGHVLVKYYN